MEPERQLSLFKLTSIADAVFKLPPSWNVAPSNDVRIIVERYDDAVSAVVREAHVARWGLIPSWAKDARIGVKMINARSETLTEKPSFATSFNSRRCLVPADGYFEWKNDAGKKCPFYITRDDGLPLAFAGLYSWWKDGEEWILSTTIITKAANQLKDIHHREPIVVDEKDFDVWLNPGNSDNEVLTEVLKKSNPFFKTARVDAAVGKVSNNSPANIHALP